MKRFVGYIADKIVKAIPRKTVRSPTIRLEGRGSFDNS